MKATKSQYEHYWDKGWVVIEGVFTRDEAEAIAQLAEEVSMRELKPDSNSGAADRSADGAMAPRKIAAPFYKDDRFRRMALDERMTSLIESLLGVEPLIVTDQLFMKPPRFGTAKPYHQDNFYFECDPADHVVTAWIALDDVDETNGCLRYLDGSHKGPILHHEPIPGEPYNLAPDPALVDTTHESLAIVGKGGVVLHHSKTLHTSHRNESDRWRRGYATHWASADVTSTNSTIADAYYRRADYAMQ